MNLRVFYLTRWGLSDGYLYLFRIFCFGASFWIFVLALRFFRFGASCRQIFALVRSAFCEALG